ncbi:MAG: tetratricopeptide repeat protein [Acidobacteriia bacterium]|nr:tetratricopeptide repeat protein [Terriglobia bacterium]
MIAVSLAAVTLAVYLQVRTFDFINFDDPGYVTENPNVSGGLTRAGIVYAFTNYTWFYWQPLTWLSHMLDCQLFGLRAGWHHLTNAALHIANSILVFLIFRRMTGALWRSAILAALFALHPLRVESVAWIAERKDVLSGFWFLMALWTYVRYTEKPGNGRYRLVLLCMLMGLMSKPMLVTVPLLFLLVDYWPLRRVAIAEKLPMVMLAALAAALTWIGQSRMGAMLWSAGIPLPMRLSNALVSYVRYIGKTIWPQNLAILYPYPASIPAWQVAGAALLLISITVAAVWVGRKHRYLAAGWLWFVVGLVPTIGLVQVGRQAMADRFSYIPLIGLFVALVWGVGGWLQDHRYVAAVAAAMVLVACGVRSWQQTRTWRDSVTVFEQALKVTRENCVAHRHLAVALEGRGSLEAALPHYAEAVRIEPSYFLAQCAYGAALLKHGEPEAAAPHFSAAIRYFPNYAAAYYGLGQIFIRTGRTREAVPAIEQALRIGLSPGDEAAAHAMLARIAPL